VLIMGDLNDEPADRSLVEHLQASSELDRVTGPTNEIKAFAAEAINYRGDDAFLYNASWRFLAPENTGSYFIASTQDETFANRYQVLDQLIASRGLLDPAGLRLDPESVRIHNTNTVATNPPADRAALIVKPRRAPATTCPSLPFSTTDPSDARRLGRRQSCTA
jgi:hypothetical protein